MERELKEKEQEYKDLLKKWDMQISCGICYDQFLRVSTLLSILNVNSLINATCSVANSRSQVLPLPPEELLLLIMLLQNVQSISLRSQLQTVGRVSALSLKVVDGCADL